MSVLLERAPSLILNKLSLNVPPISSGIRLAVHVLTVTNDAHQCFSFFPSDILKKGCKLCIFREKIPNVLCICDMVCVLIEFSSLNSFAHCERLFDVSGSNIKVQVIIILCFRELQPEAALQVIQMGVEARSRAINS